MQEERIPDYAKYSLKELLEVYSRIDKINHPKKTEAIENEIRRRTGNENIEEGLKIFNSLKSEEKPKSKFVNIVAWVIIVIASINALSGLMGFIISVNIPEESYSSFETIIPSAGMLYIKNLYLIYLSGFVFALLLLYSAIGLLKRKESTRKLLIYLLSLSISYSIFMAIFLNSVMPEFSSSSYNMDESLFGFMKTFSSVFSISFTIILSLLVIWVINKLNKKEIKLEFS